MNEKILIADDDVRINELLCEDFSQEGYEVLAVYDGEMLIETMEKVHMSDYSGRDDAGHGWMGDPGLCKKAFQCEGTDAYGFE